LATLWWESTVSEITDDAIAGQLDEGDTGPIVMLPIPALLPARGATELDRFADDGVIAAELERMAHASHPGAARHFRSALAHPAAVVQAAAAFGLGEHGSAGDAPALIALLREHAAPGARGAIVEAIGKLGDPAGIAVVVDVLRDPRQRALHPTAAEALGRIGDRAALPVLDGLATPPHGTAVDRDTRAAAARAAEAIRLHRSRETYDPMARLTEALARFDVLLGTEAAEHEPEIADPATALIALGVCHHGIVPRDIATWARWCNRPAAALRWPASRGWHFLSLADALAIRGALRLATADTGAWLPIMASDFGDHQVYVPSSFRAGTVYSIFSDEPFRPAGPGKSLADHAGAILEAWTTLQLDST
jgi:hypothetical protein